MRKIDRDSKHRATLAAKAANSKKAEDVLVLDVREITYLADYFIICSGATSRQVRAVVDEVDAALTKEHAFPLHVEGFPDCRWVLMDYGDIIVHVFEHEAREYYDLEGLWGEAAKVAVK